MADIFAPIAAMLQAKSEDEDRQAQAADKLKSWREGDKTGDEAADQAVERASHRLFSRCQ